MKINRPPKEGRLAYLSAKLGVNEDEDVIEDLADRTDGLAFAELRELLVASYCLGQDKESVLKRLKNRNGLEERYTEEESKKMLAYHFGGKDGKELLAVDVLNVINEVMG
jgi:hypothetical protein